MIVISVPSEPVAIIATPSEAEMDVSWVEPVALNGHPGRIIMGSIKLVLTSIRKY